MARNKTVKGLNRPENLTLDLYLDKDEGDLPPIQPLKDDEEEVKEEKRLKILTLNKVLTKLLISIIGANKSWNNSYKLKNKIRKTLHLSYRHNKITTKLYNIFIKSL